MFGTNEIVGQKYFRNEPEGMLLVTSRFLTLQGEGPYRGEPAVFVRLAKCNLACSFCDTWFDSGERLTFMQIFTQITDIIHDYFPNGVPRYIQEDGLGLVLTGGEPMLQKNLTAFLMAATYSQNFKWIQIESNGLLLQQIPDSTTLVVSPKCLEKDGKPVRYLAPNQEVLARADCLKFVMSSDLNSPYSEIPDWAHEWTIETGNPLFISPMNIYNRLPIKTKSSDINQRSEVDETISFWEDGLLDRESNQRNHEYAAKYCIEHGFTLNLQQHLYASLP